MVCLWNTKGYPWAPIQPVSQEQVVQTAFAQAWGISYLRGDPSPTTCLSMGTLTIKLVHCTHGQGPQRGPMWLSGPLLSDNAQRPIPPQHGERVLFKTDFSGDCVSKQFNWQLCCPLYETSTRHFENRRGDETISGLSSPPSV